MLVKELEKLGVKVDEATIADKLKELGVTEAEMTKADIESLAKLLKQESKGFLELVGDVMEKPTSEPAPLATVSKTKGRGKLAKATNKNQTPVAPGHSSEIQTAIAASKADLQSHFDLLNQIGQQVAVAKVELSRSMPALIAQKVDEILEQNPIDIDAGARRIREATASQEIQSLLDAMGLEVSFDEA